MGEHARVRVCGWRGAQVHARNGRAQPGDPAACSAEIRWTDVHTRWVHVDGGLDVDHKAVFGRSVDQEEVRAGEMRLPADARERVARWLWRADAGGDSAWAFAGDLREPFYAQADELLAEMCGPE